MARVADMTPSLAIQHPVDDEVEIPLGVVALNWVRLYLPLVTQGLPQMPGNSGPDGLGFAKRGFRGLIASGVSPTDLRAGASFAADRATSVAGALAEAARTIATMPANFIRFPNSATRVFGTATARAGRYQWLSLDAETLRAFGVMTVPGHIWRAMQRFSTWIEPVLAAEWARLIRGYAQRQGRTILPC